MPNGLYFTNPVQDTCAPRSNISIMIQNLPSISWAAERVLIALFPYQPSRQTLVAKCVLARKRNSRLDQAFRVGFVMCAGAYAAFSVFLRKIVDGDCEEIVDISGHEVRHDEREVIVLRSKVCAFQRKEKLILVGDDVSGQVSMALCRDDFWNSYQTRCCTLFER